MCPAVPEDRPVWFNGKTISEPLFCQEFLANHRLAYTENAFFTPEGKLTDENVLRAQIFDLLEPYACSGVTKKIDNIMSLLRIKAHLDELPPQPDRIHVQNGTLFLDGSFTKKEQTRRVCDAVPQNQQEWGEHAQAQRRACGAGEIVRSRFPVRYNPHADVPARWLQFLEELFWPEDIPTVQEFIGYCLIPSTAGQKMMIVKGNGGEGKSQIGAVLSRLFGVNAKDGSVGKISENQFARADLEHVHLMIDDDMRLEALKQTNYVKSIVTNRGRMDLERKGKQSYQGYMYARILAFSNGDLVSLYDRSDGFFRRQLILTAKPKRPDRVDDPHLADKLCEETEGIFLWAFQGLQRLEKNNYQFTESDRAKRSREMVRRDANNIELFMESNGYIVRGPEHSISSKDLANVYRLWSDENSYPAMKDKTLIEHLTAHQEKYALTYTNHLINSAGRQVRGFKGIGSVVMPSGFPPGKWLQVDPDDNPFKSV